jgi:hypothetical protein
MWRFQIAAILIQIGKLIRYLNFGYVNYIWEIDQVPYIKLILKKVSILVIVDQFYLGN